jgi:hypothetical protein
MLTPPELDILDATEEQENTSETTRYLSHIENKLYADIQTRKRIDSGLLFIACQFSSCSLSWLLFDLRVTLSIIQVAAVVVSLTPGLIDIGDGFNFSLSSESWNFTLGEKPLVGVVKLAIGATVTWNSTARITQEVITTQANISEIYEQIRSREGLSFQLPNTGIAVLVALAAIALLAGFKKVSTNNDTGVNEDEI